MKYKMDEKLFYEKVVSTIDNKNLMCRNSESKTELQSNSLNNTFAQPHEDESKKSNHYGLSGKKLKMLGIAVAVLLTIATAIYALYAGMLKAGITSENNAIKDNPNDMLLQQGVKTNTQIKSNIETNSQSQTQTKQQTEPQTKVQNESQTKVQNESKTQSQIEPQTQSSLQANGVTQNKKQITSGQMNIGSYVRLGSYNGEPIIWEVLSKNNGVTLVSEKIICLKAFDASESGESEEVGGSYTDNADKQKWGSNTWANSNLREWLNSASIKVNFSTQPPVPKALALGYNSYSNESGFLTNFSEIEKNAIKLINRNGVSDKVYILSENEIALMKDRRRKITNPAVQNSGFKSKNLYGVGYWWYWTSTASVEGAAYVKVVASGGESTYDDFANHGEGGVVPALNLKDDVLLFGAGTWTEPYVIK